MNIAQVVCVYPPYKGGIGTSALETAKIFHALGHKVTTFTPDYQNNRFLNQNTNSDIEKICYLKPWLKLGNGAFIPQLFYRLNDFDLVYLHYPFFGGSEVVWLNHLFNKNKKLIVHFHHDAVSQSLTAKILSFPDKLIRASLFKTADKIISASFDYIQESEIKNLFDRYQFKFQEIPFAVDIENFYPNKNKSNIKPKILFVGGLDKAHYFKGIDNLLEAVSQIPNRDWELEIIGDGDLKSSYIEKTKKLKIDKQTNFKGRLNDSDLKLAYQNADIFVLPSINKGEAFGIVLLEAMAAGLPVVATKLAGVRNVFRNSCEGLIVEPNEIKNLSEALKKLLANKNQRQAMGEAGRKLVEQKYSQEIITKNYKKLLLELFNT
jgi:glycosyltransferase involved in cell wall biosynthesis